MKIIKERIVLVVISILILMNCCACNSKSKDKKDKKEETKTTAEFESMETKPDDEIESIQEYVEGNELKFINENADFYNDSLEVKKFYVYGTHFNFEGSIGIKKLGSNSVESASLCLIDISKSDKDISSKVAGAIKINFEKKGKKVSFNASSVINKGLFLENVKQGTYALYVVVKDSKGKNLFLPLENKTKEKDIKYYTVTNLKDQSNREINIYTPNEVEEQKNSKFMFLNCYKKELPEDVYDIVIDPGHGGSDVGAIHGSYYEKDLSLEIAKMVYENLKNQGYKVLITRDGSENNDDYSVYTSYEDNGRVTLACASRAKYALSIHLNSSEADMSKGGVQIYCSSKADTSMARYLADSVVKDANTYTSNLGGSFMREDGVYSHSFGTTELAEIRSIAAQYGFAPYEVKRGDDYLYMLRELGGISTNAYTDGRHPQYGKNKWVKANYGIECCLCELAYMSVEEDFNHFMKNKDKYAKGLCNGLIKAIENNK